MNQNNMTVQHEQGFTLIEILVSIGLLAALAAIVLIAVNPARQFANMRNTQRSSDLNALLNSVGQRIAENKGQFNCTGITFPAGTTATGTSGSVIGSGVGELDIRSCLVPAYISELPVDPTNGTTWNGTTYTTGYRLFQDANGRISVFAPTVEPIIGNNVIALTR